MVYCFGTLSDNPINGAMFFLFDTLKRYLIIDSPIVGERGKKIYE